MPAAELRQVWRDTTQSPLMAGGSCGMCGRFLSGIRTINARAPASLKLRVIAGDPPIDWSKVNTSEDLRRYLNLRDQTPAELVEREVLLKGAKALVVYGAGHVWRGNSFSKEPNLVTLLDRRHPGSIRTVLRLGGEYRDSDRLEKLIGDSRRPILVRLNESEVGSLNANELVGRDIPIRMFPTHFTLAQVADFIVYTGRAPDTPSRRDAPGDADPSFSSELARRERLLPMAGR